MAREDTDLEQLTSMLQRCLGRIDEEAFRIQANGVDGLDLGETDRLEAATEELQDLIGSLVVAETADEEADVNAVLEEAAAANRPRANPATTASPRGTTESSSSSSRTGGGSKPDPKSAP